jgi:hypothetical protein
VEVSLLVASRYQGDTCGRDAHAGLEQVDECFLADFRNHHDGTSSDVVREGVSCASTARPNNIGKDIRRLEAEYCPK